MQIFAYFSIIEVEQTKKLTINIHHALCSSHGRPSPFTIVQIESMSKSTGRNCMSKSTCTFCELSSECSDIVNKQQCTNVTV